VRAPDLHPSLERRLIWRIALLYVAAFLLASTGYLIAAWHNQQVDLANELGDLATQIGKSVERGTDGKLRFDFAPRVAARVEATPELMFGALDLASGSFVDGSTLTALPLLQGPTSRSAIPTARSSTARSGWSRVRPAPCGSG